VGLPVSDVFVDTSFWYASLDPRDANHRRAEALAEDAASEGTRLHVTREIVGETLTLLRYRASAKAALLFLDEVVPALHVIDAGRDAHAAAAWLFRRLAPTRRLSYCDALSCVVVNEILHDMPCFAFDRDFRALGLTVLG
jgi:predicted nucleic acid-binding protein